MKKTQKMMQALELLPNAKPESIYHELNQKGYSWDSAKKRWLFEGLAEAPTDLIMIRVWAALEKVDDIADQLILRVCDTMKVQSRSNTYPCRPPKQKEGRIYLTFSPITKPSIKRKKPY